MRVLVLLSVTSIFVTSCVRHSENFGYQKIEVEIDRISFLRDFINVEMDLGEGIIYHRELGDFLIENRLVEALSENLEFEMLFPDGKIVDSWGNQYFVITDSRNLVVYSLGADGLKSDVKSNGDDILSTDLEGARELYGRLLETHLEDQ